MTTDGSGAKPLVIACCSATKSAPPAICLALETGDTVASAASRWQLILDTAKPDRTARALYTGRAFAIVRDAAARNGSDLAIVSAGLGIVPAGKHVPAYDLTTERGPGALASRLADWNPRAWWRAVREGRFAISLLHETETRPAVLMSLTRPYVQLLGDELEALAAHADRIRIFVSGVVKILPETARQCLMPYDERLEALGRRGTRGDFAARALADFLDHVGIGTSCIEDAARVRARLAPVSRPKRTINARVADGKLKRKIGDMRRREPGITRSQLLRRLRNEARLACSDARLRRLFAST
jgi:hypothetical protein